MEAIVKSTAGILTLTYNPDDITKRKEKFQVWYSNYIIKSPCGDRWYAINKKVEYQRRVLRMKEFIINVDKWELIGNKIYIPRSKYDYVYTDRSLENFSPARAYYVVGSPEVNGERWKVHLYKRQEAIREPIYLRENVQEVLEFLKKYFEKNKEKPEREMMLIYAPDLAIFVVRTNRRKDIYLYKKGSSNMNVFTVRPVSSEKLQPYHDLVFAARYVKNEKCLKELIRKYSTI